MLLLAFWDIGDLTLEGLQDIVDPVNTAHSWP